MNKKWIVIILSVIVLIMLGLHLFYRNVQSDLWSAEDRASRAAIEANNLTKVTHVSRSVWDQVLYIVDGVNDQNQHMIVWVDKDGHSLHAELASAGVTKEQVEGKLVSRMPNAHIISSVPSIWQDNTYAWQVFYSVKTDSETRYYYVFYKFQDGSLLITYTLPAK